MSKSHRKRPRDFSQAAKLVVDIATGQVEDRPPSAKCLGARRGAITGNPDPKHIRFEFAVSSGYAVETFRLAGFFFRSGLCGSPT
jgi:hypothetical protein